MAKERLAYLRGSSTLLTAEEVRKARDYRDNRESRQRAKSADERFATAKRFSVARARRMELASHDD